MKDWKREERVETGVKYPASAIKHPNEGDSSNEEDRKIDKEEVEYLTCKIARNYNVTSPCLQTNTNWHCCRLSDVFLKEGKAAHQYWMK